MNSTSVSRLLGPLVGLALISLSTPIMPAQSGAVAYTISTLAGKSQIGSADGDLSSARFNSPNAVALDAAGNLYVCDSVNSVIRKITPSGGVTTLAGQAGLRGSTDGAGGAARFNEPTGVAVDPAGNVYVSEGISYTVRKVTPAGVVTTLAGTANASGSANGTGAAARFAGPQGIAVDGAGNVYVADAWNHSIRKITAAGVVTTLAGSTTGSSGSADGTGGNARFSTPLGLAVDAAGNLYAADNSNQTIRKITSAGVVTTVAGRAGDQGAIDGVAGTARFSSPRGVAVDAAGNLYVSDGGNYTIRKITTAGVVTTLAGLAGGDGAVDGSGAAARFGYQPSGVAVDPSGNLFVADMNNHAIRKISATGVVTTFAGVIDSRGKTDGTGSAARFAYPLGAAVDATGVIYVGDAYNHTIRKITAAGAVTTLAGSAGVSGSTDGTGGAARFNSPCGVALDGAGNLLVIDGGNHTVRKITPAGVVTTLAGAAGVTGSADGAGNTSRFNFGDDGYAWIAADTSGNAYVADVRNNTVRKITAGGLVTTLAGQAGVSGSTNGIGTAARFSNLGGIAVDSVGNVYVVDAGGIRMVTAGGTVTPLMAPTAQPTGFGMAVDAAGNLFVAQPELGTIQRITPLGILTTIAGSRSAPSGTTDGPGANARFYAPSAVAVDGAGNLYITDSQNNTLRKGVPAPVVADSNPGRLINLSVLTDIATAGDDFTLGYVVGGTGTSGVKPLVIRAAGPSLGALGVPGTLDDPKFELFAGAARTGENDNWGGSPQLTAALAAVGAFAYTGPTSKDAATTASITTRDNSVKVSAAGTGTGQVIAEIYDATPGVSFTATSPRLINVSVRKHLGSGLTMGFVVGGSTPAKVLVRGVGPTLGAFGVTGTVADPQLTLYNSSSAKIGENNDWAGTAELTAAFAGVGAFALPAASKDAALLVTLAPGNYTAQVTGVNGTTGVALVEVYEVQ